MVLRIPFGTAPGVKREGLNYYPDAPYNLAVAAAGPRASRNVAIATLPTASAMRHDGAMVTDALLICYGVGNTARSLLSHPDLERLDVVDISREVLAASRFFDRPGSPGPLTDQVIRPQQAPFSTVG